MATLYGRLATSVNDASSLKSGTFSGVTVKASRLTTVSRDVASGMNSATVPGSRSASGGSISTAVMVAPVSKIASVNDPRPGPTSMT